MCYLLRSKRKIGFPVQVSNGIFEYYPELRDSLWLLAILIDLTTEEKNGEQKVHGGAPICDTCLAAVFRCSRKTIVRWRQKLLNFKPFPLIKAKRTPVGYSYTVLKFSKKTFKSDGTNLSHHTHNTPSSDVPKRDNSCTDHVPTDVPKRDNHIEKTGTVQNRTDAELDYTLPSEKNSNPSVTFTTPPAPSVDTSIQTARDTFKRKFGRDPLPRGKNGFYTGWTKALVEHGDALVQETLDIWISDPQTEEYLRGKRGKNGEGAGLNLFLKQCLVEKTNSFLEDARNNLRVPTPEEIERDTKEEYGEGQ